MEYQETPKAMFSWPSEPCVQCNLPSARVDIAHGNVRLHRICIDAYERAQALETPDDAR